MNETQQQAGGAWQRYGRSMIASMREVLDEADDRHHDLLLETADFWLALGLVIGLERPVEAERLLGVAQGGADERAELLSDADDLLSEAIR